MTPIRALRSFFEQQTELKPFSSQLGFGKLVGRSESLIRAVESGRVPMSPKLARVIKAKTGVSEDWLMKAEVTVDEIPSAEGTPLKHVELLARIHREISANLFAVDPGSNAADTIHRKMARALATLVEDEIYKSLTSEGSSQNGDDPANEILAWIRGRAGKMAETSSRKTHP